MSLHHLDDNLQLFNDNILDITELDIPANGVIFGCLTVKA